jgi:hypothetical protein
VCGQRGARGLDVATRLPWCARGSTSVALTTICLEANSSSGLFVSRRPLGKLPAAHRRNQNKQKNPMEENQAEGFQWAYVLAPPASHAAHPVLARRPLYRDPPTLLRLRVRDCHAMARLCGRRVEGSALDKIGCVNNGCSGSDNDRSDTSTFFFSFLARAPPKLPNTTPTTSFTFTQQHSTQYNTKHTVNPFFHIRVRAVRAHKKPSRFFGQPPKSKFPPPSMNLNQKSTRLFI